LGRLPPPTALVSLPVRTDATTPLVNTSSGLPVVTSATSSLPIATGVGLSQLPALVTNSVPSIPAIFPTPAHSGMILSPAADPIPYNLVQRIQSGQFIEMRDLLADNIALLNQMTSLSGTTSIPFATMNRTRLREVPSLVSWIYCFNAYMAVRTTDAQTQDMLAYSRLLIREALRHGGSGWMEYDRVFRRQIAINPQMAWNTLQPGLQAATILGQGASSGVYCMYCQECDHATRQCALAPLQQQLRSNVFTTTTQPTTEAGRPPRRMESLMRICINWNRGTCNRQDCSFRHVCAGCQKNHKARFCPDLPAESEYKMANRGQSTGRLPANRPTGLQS